MIYAIGSQVTRSSLPSTVRDLNLNEFQNSFTIFVVQVSKNTHQKVRESGRSMNLSYKIWCSLTFLWIGYECFYKDQSGETPFRRVS